MAPSRVIRVFLGTPGDVASERERIERVVERLNQEVLLPLNASFQLIMGSSHAMLGLGRPQALITPLVDRCDVFIGVLWTRFGTPPGETTSGESFSSGTEEEFTRALQRWQSYGAGSAGAPRILMYFSDRPANPSTIDPEQIRNVREFRRKFNACGSHPGLVASYTEIDDFEKQAHRHLLHIALQLASTTPSADVVDDFVGLPNEDWHDLFSSSSTGKFLFMYSRTWRNTFMRDLRSIVARNGQIEVLLPSPDRSSSATLLMAQKIGDSVDQLIEKITEAKDAFQEIGNHGSGSIQIRYTKEFMHHSMYLFDKGGILGLYTYRRDRVPSPAIRLRVGALHSELLADFAAIFDASAAAN